MVRPLSEALCPDVCQSSICGVNVGAKNDLPHRVSMSVVMFAGAQYGTRNVLADADIREGIKEFTQWPTIPQVSSRCYTCPHSTGCAIAWRSAKKS